MDFSLSETELMLKGSLERFLREHHSFEARKELLRSPQARSALWSSFAELGLFGIGIDESFGGSGGGFQEIAIVKEAFGKSLVCEPYLASLVLGAWILGAAGSPDQKRALLPGLVEGRIRLAFAHDEPGARGDPAKVTTLAERQGGKFRLSGRKSGVLGGDDADYLIVSARVAGANPGLSLFLLARSAPGLSIRPRTNFDDRRAAEVELGNVEIAEGALIGSEGAALPLIEQAVDRGIAALSWDAVGAMAALNDLTLDYIKTRVQFGRPIGKFQVLQHRMVDMTIAAEQARSMAILATASVDAGDAKTRARDVSAAKVAVGKAAKTVGQGAVQLHGGMGLTMEYAASHYFKRLTAFELMFGDTAHHLARFAALSP